jgi:hypothetical protein
MQKPPRIPLVCVLAPHLTQPNLPFYGDPEMMPTYRPYEQNDMSMCVPSQTGMAEICFPDLVVIGNASGMTSAHHGNLNLSAMGVPKAGHRS